MTNENNLDQIRTALERWKNDRCDVAKATELLNQGNNLVISRALYDILKTSNAESLHIYLGVNESNQLEFYLIDSHHDYKDAVPVDQLANYVTKVSCNNGLNPMASIPHFENTATPLPDALTPQQGLEYFFRWAMNKNSWLQDNVVSNPTPENEGIFQLFSVPMQDFENIFNDGANENAIVTFSLKEDNTPDMVSWGDAFKKFETLADVSLVAPPFHNGSLMEYQLLVGVN
jgi:hypothetical protein